MEWTRRIEALGQIRVDDLTRVEPSERDLHHVMKVLRAREGEEIVVTNGVGEWRICRVRAGELEPVTETTRDPRPQETTLYLCPLKGERSEWAVQKATELGVSRIVPLVSERLAVKFKGDGREKTLRKWRRVAAEAASQSRRTYDVVIEDPLDIVDVPNDVAVCDFGGTSDWRGVRAVAIGPEGGWSPTEWSASRRRLGLGPTVLRADTAAVVSAALVARAAGHWGELSDSESDG